ncbi:MAG: hypothetical protein QXE81_01375 [Desulfurococcaceae archaeon]
MDIFKKICRDEYESHNVYKLLSKGPFIPKRTRELLNKASRDEYNHYLLWRRISGECSSSLLKLKAVLYLIMLYVFGLTVVLKKIELMETNASKVYRELSNSKAHIARELERLVEEEERHEAEFISSINERRVMYIGSITLGVSDALIELTGVYTGALGVFNSTLSAGLMGLLTGIAASLSMGVASFNQAKQEASRNPFLSALYTMVSYLVVTFLLALPYLVIPSIYYAFIAMIFIALLIIAYLNVYIAILQEKSFKREFIVSSSLMLGISILLYYIGTTARSFLGLHF